MLIAALALKVKYQTKILRSKENTLSVELIKKGLEMVIPRTMFNTQKPNVWEELILVSFEQ